MPENEENLQERRPWWDDPDWDGGDDEDEELAIEIAIRNSTNPQCASNFKKVGVITKGQSILAWDESSQTVVFPQNLSVLFNKWHAVKNYIPYLQDCNAIVYEFRPYISEVSKDNKQYLYETEKIDKQKLLETLFSYKEDIVVAILASRDKDDPNALSFPPNQKSVEFLGTYKLNRVMSAMEEKVIWELVSDTCHLNYN